MRELVTILTSLTASGALAGTLIWLTKSWLSERIKTSIKHEYDEKLATFEAKLKAEHDTALERLRADLQIAASERHIRYQKLHNEAADTVAKKYALLQNVYGPVQILVSDLGWSTDPSKEELHKLIGDAVKEFREYYRPRRIYLPQKIAKLIDEFDRNLISVARRHARIAEARGTLSPDKLIELDNEVARMIDKEIPQVFEQLEDEFRALLGSKAD